MITSCCRCGLIMRVAPTRSERLGWSRSRRYCDRCAEAGSERLKKPWRLGEKFYAPGNKGKGRGLARENERPSGVMAKTIGPAGVERALELRAMGKSLRIIAAELRIKPEVIREALEAA